MRQALKWVRPLLLGVAAVCLALGIYLPIIRFETFYFFSRTPSLIELVSALVESGDVVLAAIVGLFSIGFPLLKLCSIGVQLAGGRRGAGLGRLMPHLSKWSMMDVMLVAIVIFAAKSSGVAAAFTQPGIWFYATSTVISAILPSLAESSGDRAQPN